MIIHFSSIVSIFSILSILSNFIRYKNFEKFPIFSDFSPVYDRNYFWWRSTLTPAFLWSTCPSTKTIPMFKISNNAWTRTNPNWKIWSHNWDFGWPNKEFTKLYNNCPRPVMNGCPFYSISTNIPSRIWVQTKCISGRHFWPFMAI